MNLQFLNSKFAVVLAIAVPVVVPASILAFRMPEENTMNAFNNMVDAIAARFIFEKK